MLWIWNISELWCYRKCNTCWPIRMENSITLGCSIVLDWLSVLVSLALLFLTSAQKEGRLLMTCYPFISVQEKQHFLKKTKTRPSCLISSVAVNWLCPNGQFSSDVLEEKNKGIFIHNDPTSGCNYPIIIQWKFGTWASWTAMASLLIVLKINCGEVKSYLIVLSEMS